MDNTSIVSATCYPDSPHWKIEKWLQTNDNQINKIKRTATLLIEVSWHKQPTAAKSDPINSKYMLSEKKYD